MHPNDPHLPEPPLRWPPWLTFAAIKVMSSSSSATPGCGSANSPASTSRMCDLDARRVRVRRSMHSGRRASRGRATRNQWRADRSVPIPERLVPLFKARIDGRPHGAPAVASPRGSRLSLENWKRSVRWRSAVAEIGHDKLRVHDLRHTYASLSRRAGADLRLLQKAMGHASITVTAHTYADLFDDELDNIAVALDSLSDF